MRILALAWCLWCTLHSLLITETLTRRIRDRGGFPAGIFRLAYVLFSLLGLLPVLWYQSTLPRTILFDWTGPWRIVQLALLLYALVMFTGGARVYDIRHFLGLRQWQDYRAGRPPSAAAFRASGILRLVRHPWYSGGLALLWAMGPVSDVSLVSHTILSLYLLIGTLLEERKLKRELGRPYEEYCRQVPMLVPWKGWWKGKEERAG